ncbi:hypothetical protein DFP77_15216, partial [Marinomonas foliarum]
IDTLKTEIFSELKSESGQLRLSANNLT